MVKVHTITTYFFMQFIEHLWFVHTSTISVSIAICKNSSENKFSAIENDDALASVNSLLLEYRPEHWKFGFSLWPSLVESVNLCKKKLSSCKTKNKTKCIFKNIYWKPWYYIIWYYLVYKLLKEIIISTTLILKFIVIY